MAQEPVRPLSIMKSNPYSSPSKARPLSEINPMGVRRNSPSYNSLGKKFSGSIDSSPFESSPVTNNSPRMFWKNKEVSTPSRFDTENIHCDASPSLKKRSSIENLKKASFVKNSNMFAKEHELDYDPDSSSSVDRPLATGRPLSVQLQGNAWGGSGLDGLRNQTGSFRGHRRTESSTDVPVYDAPKSQSPSKLGSSPMKSSLSTRHGGFSPEDGVLSEDETSGPGTGANTPRPHLRQPKSVTFDAGPPTINEYEMITPDPSSVASGSREGSYDSDVYDMDDSFERDGSYGREDSFDDSLEDTDKTPVVLPEDWRFMSPDIANTDLADTFEDPFKRPVSLSPSSLAELHQDEEEDSELSQAGSVNSNGERRPLPPLPNPWAASSEKQRVQSPEGKLSFGSIKPSPPRPASMSKDEILKIGQSEMPLADRLHLLSVQNHDNETKRRESLANDDNSLKQSSNKEASSPQDNDADQSIPRITKDLIKSTIVTNNFEEVAYDDSSPAVNPTHHPTTLDYANLDPDVAIPSRETSSNYEGQDIASKQSDEDKLHIMSMYAERTQTNDKENSENGVHVEGDEDDFAFESSVIHHEIPDYDDYDAEISEISEEEDGVVQSMLEVSGHQPSSGRANAGQEERSISLPEVKPFFSDKDYTFGVKSNVTPSANTNKNLPQVPPQTAKHEEAKRPSSPLDRGSPQKPLEDQTMGHRQTSTPESVVHHPIQDEDEQETFGEESPSIPEPVSTIKTHGSRLKTRPSATPADIIAMAATRRIVSGEVPSSHNLHGLDRCDTTASQASFKRRESFKMKLDIPMESVELGFGLDQEFDRLLEAQKKGYMMREQEEVVVASTRNFSGEKPSEVKPDAGQPGENREVESRSESPQKANAPAWTTEPWNGRMRRHSTRKSAISPERKVNLGAAPPLPGQESNVDTIAEDEYDSMVDKDPDDPHERGRLFVKVIKVKDLDLPLPRNEPSYFQLTLDNGLHCVTTSWLELGKTAPIGQEFELVVFDDLEFQLTLQTKLERPVSQASSIDSVEKTAKPQKAGGMGKFFMGAKKRRELEKKQQEEAARAKLMRQQELDAQRASSEPTAWDLQHDLVGPDGSFARAYVSLSNHEQQAFGRPCIIDVPCFNEWSVDDKGISTRSKLGSVQRRPPYRIARMELQLLYIPRPRDAQDEDLPKSMSAAARQLKEAEASASRSFEGHLSQQGGDCPYWRRRYFKLNGSELKAYHEHTRQPRAKISLTKAIKLIDDRSTLTKPELPEPESPSKSPTKKGGRRKSAFAQDEEGYMFVEEGFRVRFANGEVIDFYADNAKEKQAWMSVLSEAIGKDPASEKQTWTQLVLAREKLMSNKAAQEASSQRSPTKSAPTSPQKSTAGSSIPRRAVATTSSATVAKEKPLPNEPPTEKAKPVTSSPSKLKQPSTVSPAKSQPSSIPSKSNPSKRSSVATPLQTQPRSDAKATGRRMAVKSMIF